MASSVPDNSGGAPGSAAAPAYRVAGASTDCWPATWATPTAGGKLRVARILTHAGLPEPQRQIRFVTAAGERFVDLGYPGDRIVALEYDSDRWHSSVRQRHADAERRNGIRVGGGLVVEITPALVRRPAALVATVRSALAAAGHPMAIQGSLLGA